MQTCAKCGNTGPVAGDQTDAGPDELALDSRGLVAANRYVCGACLEAAEDVQAGRDRLSPSVATEADDQTVYVVRDAAGEYVRAGGRRTPASNEAQEFESFVAAQAACTRSTDVVLTREVE